MDARGRAARSARAAALAGFALLLPSLATAQLMDASGVQRIDARDFDQVPVAGDELGAALAVGDFDGDGFDDLAIGAPARDAGAGSVSLLRGGPDGLVPASLATPALEGALGRALAAGDFDGDGFDDLAVGVPEASGEGRVLIAYGASADPLEDQLVRSSADVGCGAAADGDEFGAALAAGDIDGDGAAELAIGLPGASSDTGAICVIKGNAARSTVGRRLQQATPYVPAIPEAGDRYGAALAIAELDGNAPRDLAIGVPSEAPGLNPHGGSAEVYFGTGDADLVDFFDGGAAVQENHLDGETIEDGERFGAALLGADLDASGPGELVVGAPGEDASAGAVYVMHQLVGGVEGVRLDPADVAGAAGAPGGLFGTALAAADLDGDAYPELVVGMPGAAVLVPPVAAGAVAIFRGSAQGPTAGRSFAQEDLAPGAASEAGDRFGLALAAGDFDGDGRDALAIGAPGDAADGIASGAVYVVPEPGARALALAAAAAVAARARRRR